MTNFSLYFRPSLYGLLLVLTLFALPATARSQAGAAANGQGLTTLPDQPANTTLTTNTILPNPIWSTTRTFPATATLIGDTYELNNLATGRVQSPLVAVEGDTFYTLEGWVKGEFYQGEVADVVTRIEAWYYQPTRQMTAPAEIIWQTTNVNSSWAELSGGFFTPSGTGWYIQIKLIIERANGWVAFDDFSLTSESLGEIELPDPGFESGTWSEIPDPDYPATSLWRGNSGPAVPTHTGSYSMVLSNLGHAELVSPFIPIALNSQTAQVWLRGEVDGGLSGGTIAVTIDYYDSNGVYISSTPPWTATSYNNLKWQQATVWGNRPSTAVQLKIRLSNAFNNGWIAFDDVTLSDGDTVVVVPDSNFEQGGIWETSYKSEFPAGIAWRGEGTGRRPSPNYAYMLTNEAYGTVASSYITVRGGRTYRLAVPVRGESAVLAGENIWHVRVSYYNSQETLIGEKNWYDRDMNTNDWTQQAFLFTAPSSARRIRVAISSEQANGWFAFDDVILTGSRALPTEIEGD